MKIVRAWWIPAEDGGPEREYHWPYVNNEFGIRLYYGGDQKSIQLARVKNGKKAIIFVDSSVKSFDFLDLFPARSVVVFFVSDETYSAWSTIQVLIKPSTSKIFRDYPLGNFIETIHYPAILIRAIQEKFAFKVPMKPLFRAFFSGIMIVSKQYCMVSLSFLVKKRLDWLPLGYTYGFAENYKRHFKVGTNISILQHSLKMLTDQGDSTNKSNVFFSGQLGGFDRQVIIKRSQAFGLELGPIFEKFGGPQDPVARKEAELNYFLGLLGSEFSICPPGNYSTQTFRYLESLILHSYPLLKKWVLSDPISRPRQEVTFEFYLEHLNSLERTLIREEIKNHLLFIKAKTLQISSEI